jgi:hypothetical protein
MAAKKKRIKVSNPDGQFALYGVKRRGRGASFGQKKLLQSHWIKDVHGFEGACRQAEEYAQNPDFITVEIRDKSTNKTVAVASKD